MLHCLIPASQAGQNPTVARGDSDQGLRELTKRSTPEQPENGRTTDKQFRINCQ